MLCWLFYHQVASTTYLAELQIVSPRCAALPAAMGTYMTTTTSTRKKEKRGRRKIVLPCLKPNWAYWMESSFISRCYLQERLLQIQPSAWRTAAGLLAETVRDGALLRAYPCAHALLLRLFKHKYEPVSHECVLLFQETAQEGRTDANN